MGRISVFTLMDKTEDAIKKIKNMDIKEMPICNVRIRCAPNGEPAGVRIYEKFQEYTRDITVLEVSVDNNGKIILKNELITFTKDYKYFDEIFYLFAIVVKYTNIWDKRIKQGVFFRKSKPSYFLGDDNDMYLVIKQSEILGKHEEMDNALCQFCELLCSEGIDEDEADLMRASFEIAVGTHCDTSYGKSKTELGDVILKVKDIMIVKEFKKVENKPKKTGFKNKLRRNIFITKN